jgi:hypothetical protein
MDHEQVALAALERGGDAYLDAELIGLVGLPLLMHSTSGACRLWILRQLSRRSANARTGPKPIN